LYDMKHLISIPSWYDDFKLSYFDVLGNEWLLLDTNGARGTGIAQRLLVAIAWDGKQFRTVAAESLDYRCVRPTSPADYALDVKHAFIFEGAGLSLRLEYTLTRDQEVVGQWSNVLRWSTPSFAFTQSESATIRSNSTVDAIRARIERVREYSLAHPLDPTRGSDAWIMMDSGLSDVLAPACFP
jgi:hypothetical protein